MDCEARIIDLAQIRHQNHRFKISVRPLPEALIASIEMIGLINRPILLEENGGYTIISGFARLAACRRLSWAAVPAHCLRADTPHHICALVAVADNALQRTLNIVEQARACALLSNSFSLPDELIAAAKSAGLTLNAELSEKLLLVNAMPENLQSGLIDGSIALPTAMRIGTLRDMAAAEEIVTLLRELKISLSRQKELLDWIEALQMREQISCSELLTEGPLAQWRADLSLDTPRRAALIRQYLKKRRYPTISRFETRYQETIKELAPGKGIEISPPPNFEGRTFSIKIDFSSTAELMQRVSEIRRLSQIPLVADLLDQKMFSGDAAKG